MLKAAATHCPSFIAAVGALFNRLREAKRIPRSWRKAQLVLLQKPLKTSDPAEVPEFRPISLLSCLFKCYESVFNRRLQFFLETEYPALFKHQFGFRAERSTHSAIIQILEHISQARQRRHTTLLSSIDFAKAFDRVNMHLCVDKLMHLTQNADFCRLIHNMTETRQIAACSDGKRCKYLTVNRGIPQGSSIAPTLFLVMVSDLLADIERINPTKKASLSATQYADDLNLVVSAKTKNECAALQLQCMDVIREWCVKWEMVIHPKKSLFQWFETDRNS